MSPEPPAVHRAHLHDPHGLRTEHVVEVAIGLADADGLGALSMRRIAAELGVATMSLYPRVRGKDELLNLMLDAVFAEFPPPVALLTPVAGSRLGWRTRVELIARLQWSAYTRHRWVPALLSMSRPQKVPHGMVHTEALLRAFDGFGLSPTVQLHAAVMVAGYVRGHAIGLEAERVAEQDSGLTADEWMESTQPTADAVLATWSMPMLARIAEQLEIEMDLGSQFEFGLARLLDGYATWLDTR